MITSLSDRRRERVFCLIAEFVTRYGHAVGMPDETGRPTVLAAIQLVSRCSGCGQDQPAGHVCRSRRETVHG